MSHSFYMLIDVVVAAAAVFTVVFVEAGCADDIDNCREALSELAVIEVRAAE